MKGKGPMNDKIIVEKLHTIDSTNLELKRRVREEKISANVLIADEQTAGRGRLGRTFESPDKTGLYMSLLIKVDFSKEEPMLITSAAAVAVTRAIRSLTGFDALIKWVNDIYIDNKKVCGILAEAVTSPGGEMYVILGIGVNISTAAGSFSSEVSKIAGALFSDESAKSETQNNLPESDIDSFKDKLAQKITDEFFNIYADIADRTFLEDYRKWSLVIGKEVRYYENDTWKNGKAIDIDDNGALLVEVEKQLMTLNTGEITLRLQ